MSGVAVPGMKQKDDALTTVMKGLQIARDVYGIKTAADQNERAEEDRTQAKKERAYISQGGMTPLQKTAMEKTHSFSDQQTAGSTPVFIGTPDQNTPMFASVRKAKEPPNTVQWKAESVQNGKKGTLIHLTDGTEKFVDGVPDAPKEDKTASNAQDLRKEYNAHPVTKDTVQLATNFKKISAAASNPNPTGATDISLVYSFMKMNDPGSTVREGEYATAENSGGIPPRIANIYNKIIEGQRLAPEQRKAFLDESRSLLNGQLELQNEQDMRYSELAKQFKVPAASIIDPTFEKLRAMPKSGAVASKPGSGEAQAGTKSTIAPGATVEIGGRRFKVASDGETLIPLDVEENSKAIPPQQGR